MRKLFLSVFIICFTVINTTFAQKFGFVDTDFILKQVPEFQKAQSQVDQISAEWQAEIEKMYQEIDKMYRNYQAEEILLTEEMKKDRQNKIMDKEKSVKEYQKKKFGFEGELFNKKQEMIKPVQDKVYEAVKKVAKDKQLQFMFDRSGDLVMLYADDKHNYSKEVLEELGYTGKQETENTGKSTENKPGMTKEKSDKMEKPGEIKKK